MVSKTIDHTIQRYAPDQESLKKMLADKNLRESLKADAQKQVKNSILLWEIARIENLSVEENEVDNHIKKSNPNLSQNNKITNEMKEQIKESLLLQKVINLILENATVTKIPVALHKS